MNFWRYRKAVLILGFIAVFLLLGVIKKVFAASFVSYSLTSEITGTRHYVNLSVTGGMAVNYIPVPSSMCPDDKQIYRLSTDYYITPFGAAYSWGNNGYTYNILYPAVFSLGRSTLCSENFGWGAIVNQNLTANYTWIASSSVPVDTQSEFSIVKYPSLQQIQNNITDLCFIATGADDNGKTSDGGYIIIEFYTQYVGGSYEITGQNSYICRKIFPSQQIGASGMVGKGNGEQNKAGGKYYKGSSKRQYGAGLYESFH